MPLKLIPPKVGRTPFWRVRGTYLRQYVDRSTGTSEKSVAQRALAKIKSDIECGAFTDRAPLTLAAAIVSFVQAGGEGRFLEPILIYFGKGYALSNINQRIADAAAHAIYPKAKPATRLRQFYAPLKAVIKHAGISIIINNPKGTSNPRTIWLEPPQIEAVLSSAHDVDPEFAILMTMLAYTGLRLSEALGCRCEDVRLVDSFAFIGKTKNGDPRPVYLPPRVVAALAGHPKGMERTGRVFRWHKGSRLYGLAKRAYGAARIDDGGAPFHIWRHTYGTLMTRAGADLVSTGAWRSRSAASVYQHFIVTEEAKRAASLPGASVVRVDDK